ncbi:DUF6896 domain-containing protein [Flammeovirga kamogawensis]|uniref:DUF6896 domain-containing protein n=1 Tax=Flammeovirga kamogawensis TaxID=373891 RepID=A0ABX8H3P2_9BACT|nr:hypothetical protein [Flammeovirga kamogawensis]MBB6461870.1 hypothetical protein [Flammeovirga kamogawensis]QWG10516.1 hypothetical protein KM029_26445 [Flammeovirga kamogawensis]TRX63625.1 hypothetical protein EO216_24720 [Flammeovirga kamogawensis]
MDNKISIDFQNKKASFQELERIIEESIDSQIAITNVIVDENILKQLESKFQAKLIYYIAWSKILILENSITTQYVISNLDGFLQCFIEFDRKAHEMMNLMASIFEIDLNDFAQINDLKRNKSKNQRGQINSSWNYFFHGAECAFENMKTGQYLDVKIIYGREYGVIGNFFLYRFIETSESLKTQFQLLKGKSQNLRKVINVFKEEGYLINRRNYDFEELILNREKVKRYLYKTLD